MYIITKNKPTKTQPFNKSVQIVQSIRTGQKVQQKIIKHIGVAHSQTELIDLKILAESIKHTIENKQQLSLFNDEQQTIDQAASDKIYLEQATATALKKPSNYDEQDYQLDIRGLKETNRVINGIHDIYGKLFDDLSLRKVFVNPARQMSIVKVFKEIVLARIANPDSKRASVNHLAKQFGVKLKLDKVYRMMDKLDDTAIDKLNQLVYHQTQQLVDKIDVIFFDATTLYFESFTEDEFKRNGYSKDLKFNQPQVVLALMVTKQGLPVGYQAFSGDTFDGHTLIPALEQLKAKYDLDKVVYVADAGMFNKDNLAALDEKGFDYIVGSRIKNLPKTLSQQVLDKCNYQAMDPSNPGTQVARFEHNGRILIVSHSQKRARKDKHDREKGIKKIQEKLKHNQSLKSHLSNQGYKKYLQLSDDKTKLSLNKDKILADAQWDGLKGFTISADSELSNQEVLTQYNNLWQVEQSFRVTKHDLRIRPIYHWKPNRVKAHLAISFAAYTLIRHLEYRVKLQYKKLSPEVIKDLLLSVQSSLVYAKDKGIKYAIPSDMTVDVKKIYRLMEVKRPTTPYIIEKKIM